MRAPVSVNAAKSKGGYETFCASSLVVLCPTGNNFLELHMNSKTHTNKQVDKTNFEDMYCIYTHGT